MQENTLNVVPHPAAKSVEPEHVLAALPGPDIETRVREIVGDILAKDATAITTRSRFVEDLGADSLHVVEVAMALEDAFGIELSDDVVERIMTIEDAVSLVQSQKEA